MPLAAGVAPSFRIPVRDMTSVQAALEHTLNAREGTGRASIQQLPALLQLELIRHRFDEKSRNWEKVTDHLELNETIDLSPWLSDQTVEARYSLYGLIVHSGSLRSGHFHSVLRPGGPGSSWYAFPYPATVVVRRTRKQAIDDHQGVRDPQARSDGSEPVAYVLMYVRHDTVAEMVPDLDSDVSPPEWISKFISVTFSPIVIVPLFPQPLRRCMIAHRSFSDRLA